VQFGRRRAGKSTQVGFAVHLINSAAAILPGSRGALHNVSAAITFGASIFVLREAGMNEQQFRALPQPSSSSTPNTLHLKPLVRRFRKKEF
jgi:hypothetical protein